MRVNIYAEEMTDRVEIISKEVDGRSYTGIRFYLELPATVNGEQHKGPFIHRPGDDDSSAVTFWGKRDLRAVLTKALALLDDHYGTHPALVSVFRSCGKVHGTIPEDGLCLACEVDRLTAEAVACDEHGQAGPSREALMEAVRHAYCGDHSEGFIGQHDLSVACKGCSSAVKVLRTCTSEATHNGQMGPSRAQLLSAIRLVAMDRGFDFAPDDDSGEPVLVANLNDVFGPAADAENVPWECVEEVAAAMARCPEHGDILWVLKQRGNPAIWRPERFKIEECVRCTP